MKCTRIHPAALIALLCLAGTAQAQPVERDGLLRDGDGRTLYTFDKDSGGQSQCYDGCAAAWPPFVAKAGTQASGKLTLHTRKDGSLQWGVQGKPLYLYAGDARPGDTSGDGSGGVWHVVRTTAPAKAPDKAAPRSYGTTY